MGYAVAHIKCFLALWAVMGMAYFTLEGFWRGWTNIAMFFIGGFCGAVIGLLNEFQWHRRLTVRQQCLIGTVIILVIEFASGCVLNFWLHLGIWNYGGVPGNILGQVCIPYALLWFALCPLAIWLDDWVRWKLFNESEPCSLWATYKKLFSTDRR